MVFIDSPSSTKAGGRHSDCRWKGYEMDLYEVFLSERVGIGAGMMAKVYSWNGFAYKCFSEG